MQKTMFGNTAKLQVMLTMVFVVLCAGSPVQAGEEFALDGGHSDISFSAPHFGVSRMGGWFTEASGKLVLEEDMTKSMVEINITTPSVMATSQGRTDAIKSAFFLAVEEHPEMTFKSTKFEKKGDHWVVTGDLTVRGNTKSVSFPFDFKGPMPDPFGGIRCGMMAELTVERQDFGITFDRKMKDGTPFVGNDVKINLAVEFARKK